MQLQDRKYIFKIDLHLQDCIQIARITARITRCRGTEIYRTPLPTVQTTGPKWTIFQRETPLGNPLSGTEAIFEFPTTSQDT